MFHSRVHARSAQGDSIHPRWCRCSDCRQPTRRVAVVQAQAGALCIFLVVIYGLLLFLAPEIATSFGWGAR